MPAKRARKGAERTRTAVRALRAEGEGSVQSFEVNGAVYWRAERGRDQEPWIRYFTTESAARRFGGRASSKSERRIRAAGSAVPK